jgi:FixJ family two-component response regulator
MKKGAVLEPRERALLSRMIAESSLTSVARKLGIAIDTCSRAASGGRCNGSTVQLLRLRLAGAAFDDGGVAQ